MTNRTPLTGPCVWQGKDIEDSKRWIRQLSPGHVAELESALAAVKDKPWQEIKRADFPLGRARRPARRHRATSWRTAAGS